jgi:hypothetical protein
MSASFRFDPSLSGTSAHGIGETPESRAEKP